MIVTVAAWAKGSCADELFGAGTMTFTVLCRDRASGLLGAATASRSLAGANAVLAIDPTVGAVASQAWTNRGLRHLLLEALRAGAAPSQAVACVPEWDEHPELRQVGAITIDGEPAAFTGSSNTAWAGELIGADFVVVGNLLAGERVLQAMATAMQSAAPLVVGGAQQGDTPEAALAQRLVEVLRAGEAAGGDVRGRQSAGMLIAAVSRHPLYPPEFLYDLRVDDDEDPLRRLEALAALRTRDRAAKAPVAASPDAAISARTE